MKVADVIGVKTNERGGEGDEIDEHGKVGTEMDADMGHAGMGERTPRVGEEQFRVDEYFRFMGVDVVSSLKASSIAASGAGY